jgi:hypothetical protein
VMDGLTVIEGWMECDVWMDGWMEFVGWID